MRQLSDEKKINLTMRKRFGSENERRSGLPDERLFDDIDQ